MHKTPNKARFIVASSKSLVKPLAKAVTSAFQVFYNKIENYIDK